MKVLVVGGAGYIGSHMVRMLGEAGHTVTAFDNLSLGHRDAVLHGDLVVGDILDPAALRAVFAHGRFDVVFHFAAFAYVRESVHEPRKYYVNNVAGSLNLVTAMLDAGVKRLVFSSTCATYGNADGDLSEDSPQRPVNPYGATKLAIERMLQDFGPPYGLDSVSLRYFNAAGAAMDGRLRERHDPEPHIVPLLLQEAERVLAGGDPRATTVEVYGTDFPTPDGSCVRDYIHVEDLCHAHLLAMERLAAGATRGAEAYNLGSGRGHSVLELITATRDVTGAPITYRAVPRKAGDPPRLVATATAAERILGWRPRHTELPAIVRSAWHASYPHRRPHPAVHLP